MKTQTQEEYANELIGQFHHIVRDKPDINNRYQEAKKCAILSIEKIIETLTYESGLGKYFELTPEFEYYNQVLTILKTK